MSNDMRTSALTPLPGRCGKVAIVEGLIGAGKSTLTKMLGQALGSSTLVLDEPDEVGGLNPYLGDYYADAKRWSFTMQAHLLGLRFRSHQAAQWHALSGAGHAVLDRSYFGDTAFARLQHKCGFMSDREYETYRALYHAMTASVLLPSVCVRVLVSPQVAVDRVSRRMSAREGRRCEATIGLDYLHDLETEIDHMVGVLRAQGVCVLDVPWDEDRDESSLRAAVAGLAHRIINLRAPDLFLDLHRRTL